MINKELLDQSIKSSGLKLDYIAFRLGISRGALIKKRNGITEFKLSEIVELSRLLKLNKRQRDSIFFADVFD